MSRRSDPEVVFWRDAHFELNESDLDFDDYIVKTVGWVTEDGRWLRIVGEYMPGARGGRQVTRVWQGDVVRRQQLMPVPAKAPDAVAYPMKAPRDPEPKGGPGEEETAHGIS